MRTCAREFRRGRPSARYKAARNGPAPEKERRFGAFSLPRFRPFPSPVSRSVRPRSDRCPDRASDSCQLPTYRQPDPCSAGPAIDPASRRSDFYRAYSGMPDRIGFLTRPRFRVADSRMPDPRLSDRESNADARSDRIPRSTARFDPILPIRPSGAIGEYLYEILKLPVVAVVPHPERDPLLDPVVSDDFLSRFERLFLFLRLRAESAPA